MNESILKGKIVILKPMAETFVTSKYLAWLHNPKVNYALKTIDLDMNGLRHYVEKRMRDPNSRFWAICDSDTDVHIGNIKLEPIDWETRITNFGIMIGVAAFWRRGIASEATKLVAEYAIHSLKLRKVELGLWADNIAALRAYEKVGFVVEKILPQHETHGDKMHDLIKMAFK